MILIITCQGQEHHNALSIAIKKLYITNSFTFKIFSVATLSGLDVNIRTTPSLKTRHAVAKVVTYIYIIFNKFCIEVQLQT